MVSRRFVLLVCRFCRAKGTVHSLAEKNGELRIANCVDPGKGDESIR